MAVGEDPERQAVCGHLDQVRAVEPSSADSCPACVAAGDSWVHLRMCQTCGNIGCCDSSDNKHATAHHQSTGHPLVRSYEPGEGWWWCYDDQLLFEVAGSFPPRPA
ncbi:UBP-type zinc finger domain-containing protein [Streptomyces sp. NPDC018031]|uniref:UBP-type zinc finger domain-containing protein n=1 Tax=Streptomyces sp. NPDC018031 TaxID=3365033 RepID=UPI00379E76D5